MRISVLLGVLFALFYIGSETLLAKEHIVRVVTDNENGLTFFTPKSITISAGDTVAWINATDDLHNVIAYPDGFPANALGFYSPIMKAKGDTFRHTFTMPGTYQYHCIPHVFMGMRGTVIVDRESKVTEMNAPSPEQIKAYRSRLLEFYDSAEFDFMPDKVRKAIGEEADSR